MENALFDAPGRGRNAEITDDEKAWIINIACQKPVNLGYSAEVWTRALLTKHINKFAEEAGHTRLSTISQSKVRTILEEADIKPNKITYYCENRDPDFDQKMHNVLLVYKQLSLQFDEKGQLIPFKEDEQVVHVLSYDEKPGIQAIVDGIIGRIHSCGLCFADSITDNWLCDTWPGSKYGGNCQCSDAIRRSLCESHHFAYGKRIRNYQDRL